VLDYPEALRQLHREFVRAGSDIVEALTYYAHRDKMRRIGREEDIETLNRQALRIAKEAAAEENVLMAGNICNTWVYDHQKPKESGAIVRKMYEEQVRWAQEEGADFIIAETLFYLGEAEIALEVISSFGLEAVVTLGAFSSQTRDGISWAEACRRLEEHGATVVGLNCARGPESIWPVLEDILSTVHGAVAALPVPYRTNAQTPVFTQFLDIDGDQAFPINLDPFLLSRKEVAHFAQEAYAAGVRYLGLCCGNAPHFFRAMAEALGRTVPASRYSPDITGHSMLGTDIQEHNRPYRKEWFVQGGA
jgi:betaine-homocysteine S-methyltransferase